MSKLGDAVSIFGRNSRQYLLVRIGNKQYGFDINYVSNLIRVETIIRVPKAQPYLKGIINLRGEIIAVVRICPEKAFLEDATTEDARIVILSSGESEKIGIIVDQVYGMTEEEVELFDVQAVACGLD